MTNLADLCNPSEHAEQTHFFLMAAYLLTSEQYELLYAIPNGGLRDKRNAASLTAEGVKRGVPDVSFDYPSNGYHGLRIEFKRRKKSLSRVSPAQERKIALLNKYGYRAVVCYGSDEAIEVLTEYLKGERTTDEEKT